MKPYLSLAVLAGLLGICFSAEADIVLSNSGKPNADVVVVSQTSWVITPFTVDSSADYTLASITLDFVNLDLSTPSGLIGSLFFDDNGSLGPLLVELDTPTGGNDGEALFLASASPVVLTAGERYFFALYASGANFNVGYSSDTGADPGSSWQFDPGGYVTQSGYSETPSSPSGNQIKMTIDAIPEPSVITLISLAGLGLIVVRRLTSSHD